MKSGGDQVHTLDVPNGTLHVRGQAPDFLVKGSTPYNQLGTPSVFGWVDSDGLLTLTF